MAWGGKTEKWLPKWKSQITARRVLKRRFVVMAQACAVAGPKGLTGNRVLNGEESGNVTVLARDFYLGLSAADLSTLHWAKGCSNTPPGAKQPGFLHLSDFLKIPTLSVAGAGCMAAFVYDLRLWALQMMVRNPRTFIAQDRVDFENAVNAAIAAATVPIETYRQNPDQYGEPGDPDQAFYYYQMQLAKILSDRASRLGEEGLAAWMASTGPIRAAWTQSVATVPAEFRNNPNIVALTANLEKAVKLSVKNYGDVLVLEL